MKFQNYIKILTKKWGPFNKNGHAYEQLTLSFVSEKTKFNVYFEKQSKDEINKSFEILNADIHPQLLEFYNYTNGCRLFSKSLCIFGLQKYPNEVYEPFDIFIENNRYKKILENKYVCFGSFGNDYLFVYQKQNANKTYIIDVNSNEIIKEFNDVVSLFDELFIKLLNLYDDKGKKIVPNKIFKGIKALENITLDFEDLN